MKPEIEIDTVERLAFEPLVRRWHDVRTDTPPILVEILIATTRQRSPIRLAWRGLRFEGDTVGVWLTGAMCERGDWVADDVVTHWMPLPDFPGA